jgi:hypothetical protein
VTADAVDLPARGAHDAHTLTPDVPVTLT